MSKGSDYKSMAVAGGSQKNTIEEYKKPKDALEHLGSFRYEVV